MESNAPYNVPESDRQALVHLMGKALKALLPFLNASENHLATHGHQGTGNLEEDVRKIVAKYDDYVMSDNASTGFVLITTTDEDCNMEMEISEGHLMQAFITLIDSDMAFRRACFVAVNQYVASNLDAVTNTTSEGINAGT